MKLVLKIDGTTYDMYSAALHNAIKHIQAELTTAKAENEDLCDNVDAARQDLSDYLDGTLEGRLRDENERLKKFARPVIEQECWSIFDQDGGDIEEWAEKSGLIIRHTVTEKDIVVHITDEEYDYDVGDTLFVFSDVLKESEDEV